MHLQLRRLSATFLRFCIVTPSECSGVTQIVLLFYFEAIVQREARGRARAFRVARLCPKAKILLCCNHLRKLVAFFGMWDGIQVDWRNCVRLRSRRHPTQLDLTWTPCAALSLLLCMLQPPVLSSHSVSSSALGNKPAVLSISLPTCWGSVSHWLPEEERHCFGNLPLATVRWVRNRINSRNTDRIFTSFRQWGLTGYSCTTTPTAAGRSPQWVSHLDETARSRKSAGYGRPALPRSPQRPPL